MLRVSSGGEEVVAPADRAADRRRAGVRAPGRAAGRPRRAAASCDLDQLPLPGDYNQTLLRLLASPNIASQALGLSASTTTLVRQQHRRRPGSDAAVLRIKGTQQGDRAERRLQQPLLRARSLRRRDDRGGRGGAQRRLRRRRADRRHRLPQLRQPREAGDHVAVPRGGARHPRRLHRARRAGGQRQRQLLQRDRGPRRFRRRRRSRMVGLLDRRRAITRRSGSRARATSSCCSAAPARSSAAASTWRSRTTWCAARRRGSISTVEKQVQRVCLPAIREGLVRSAHDVAEGGLAVALAECCISGPGAPARRRDRAGGGDPARRAALRREPVAHHRCRCAGATSAACASWRAPPTCRCTVLGEVRGRRLRDRHADRRRTVADAARDAWATALPRRMAAWRGDDAERLPIDEPDRFHEECGVVGVFGHPEAANLVYLGLYALQHRGQEGCRHRLVRRRRAASRTAASAWSPTSSTRTSSARLERHRGDRPQPLLHHRPDAAQEHAAVRRRVRRAAASPSRTTATWSTPSSCASSSRRAARSSSRRSTPR